MDTTARLSWPKTTLCQWNEDTAPVGQGLNLKESIIRPFSGPPIPPYTLFPFPHMRSHLSSITPPTETNNTLPTHPAGRDRNYIPTDVSFNSISAIKPHTQLAADEMDGRALGGSLLPTSDPYSKSHSPNSGSHPFGDVDLSK
ncbi:unnamed protein product, partial [Echinostoma caproni]|uniref:TORC_M domain-containing protein n=1 Tax=Echinostoma caproni TaxID=27848 RepID=A0A183A4F8_9TREM